MGRPKRPSPAHDLAYRALRRNRRNVREVSRHEKLTWVHVKTPLSELFNPDREQAFGSLLSHSPRAEDTNVMLSL